MAIVQSIDSALEKNIGPHGVAADALNAALGARGGRARLAARAPCRRRPAAAAAAGDSTTTCSRSATPRAGLPTAPPTSSCSAPAAPASAGRRWRSWPAIARAGRRRVARSRRACISSTISIRRPFATLLGKLPHRDHALCRDLEIRRHRRNADADHRRAVGAEGGRVWRRASPISFSASPSRPKPASATACAICSRNITCRCSITIRASAAASRR